MAAASLENSLRPNAGSISRVSGHTTLGGLPTHFFSLNTCDWLSVVSPYMNPTNHKQEGFGRKIIEEEHTFLPVFSKSYKVTMACITCMLY